MFVYLLWVNMMDSFAFDCSVWFKSKSCYIQPQISWIDVIGAELSGGFTFIS